MYQVSLECRGEWRAAENVIIKNDKMSCHHQFLPHTSDIVSGDKNHTHHRFLELSMILSFLLKLFIRAWGVELNHLVPVFLWWPHFEWSEAWFKEIFCLPLVSPSRVRKLVIWTITNRTISKNMWSNDYHLLRTFLSNKVTFCMMSSKVLNFHLLFYLEAQFWGTNISLWWTMAM